MEVLATALVVETTV